MTANRKQEINDRIESKSNADLVFFLTSITEQIASEGYNEDRNYMQEVAFNEILKRMGGNE